MKLNGFVAGCMGLVGFAVSILAGVQADNPFGTVIFRALLASLACYVIGYGVGVVGSMVATEHAQRIATEVARQDAAIAAKRAQELSEMTARAQATANGEAPVAAHA